MDAKTMFQAPGRSSEKTSESSPDRIAMTMTREFLS